MQNWDKVYQNNHLSLMKIHIGLAIFYVLMMAAMLFLLFYDVSFSQMNLGNFLFVLLILMTPIGLHLALAHGARQKSELSRRLSMAVFILIFLIFPIGSIFSVCVGFPALQWEDEQSN